MPKTPLIAATTVKSALFLLLSVWAVASIVWQGVHANEVWFHNRHVEQTARAFAIHDVDDAVFIHDIRSHHTASGPLFWWHNGWHGTAYPYYWRPLTMLGFWVEYHLFGAYRFDRWQIADIFFHVLFAAVLAAFAVRVSGSRFAAPIAVIIFTAFEILDIPVLTRFLYSFTTPQAAVILQNWKDQPEAWAGICSLLSQLSAMRNRWSAALAFAVASVCFKESGWITFPMLLATLLYSGNLRKVPRSMWIATAVSWIVLIAFRASSGHNVMFPPHDKGMQYGLVRYTNDVVDANVKLLGTDSWPLILFAIVAAWAILVGLLPLLARDNRPIRFGVIPRLLAVIVGGAITAVLLGVTHHADPLTGFALLVDPNVGLLHVGPAFAEALVLAIAWTYRPVRRQAAYLYVLVLLSALPDIIVLQPNAHMLYLTHGLQCALVTTIGLAVVHRIAGRFTNRSASVEEAEPIVATA